MGLGLKVPEMSKAAREKGEKFVKAAQDGRTDEVADLILQGVDINYRTEVRSVLKSVWKYRRGSRGTKVIAFSPSTERRVHRLGESSTTEPHRYRGVAD